jgi:hypothetical protein
MAPERPPARAAERRRMSGCLGILLLLFGAPLIIEGVVILLRAVREPHRFIRSDDSYFGMIGFGIGVFCSFVGARWARYAFRGPSDK